LQRSEKVWKGQETGKISFYYNPDGLLDSTRSSWGTFIFKRRKKGKYKLIEMTNEIASYRWVYNLTGQCVRGEISMKDIPGIERESGYKGNLKSKSNYYYNQDGTLSKVVSKTAGQPGYTMYHSYSQ
jgi:hypothetical protein